VFGGCSTHRLDDVGRFVLPKRFRLSLGESFVITRGINCLLVLTNDAFYKISDKALELAGPVEALFNQSVSSIYHHLFAEMVEARVDGQGRIQLTPELRAHAGIDRDLVMIGVGNWVEIWSVERWEDYKKKSLTPENLVDAAQVVFGKKDAGESDGEVPSSGSSE